MALVVSSTRFLFQHAAMCFSSLQTCYREMLREVSYLLLGQLHLVELLHVLLVVLFLQLPDENELLFGTVRVLLRRVLLELHGCLRV